MSHDDRAGRYATVGAALATLGDAELAGLVERAGVVRACAAGADPAGVPAEVADVIRRYAPVATVMNDFYWELFGASRRTPYPARRVERALAAVPGLGGALDAVTRGLTTGR